MNIQLFWARDFYEITAQLAYSVGFWLDSFFAYRVAILIFWVIRAIANHEFQVGFPALPPFLSDGDPGANRSTDFSLYPFLQTMPQGYTMYGTQMPLQQAAPQQSGGVVLSPSYNSRAYPAAHSSPALMERLRQLQQQPSGYAQQQASPYLQPVAGSQRWYLLK